MVTRDLDEILENLVSHYISTIKANMGQFKHLTAVVFAVVPPMVYPVMEQAFLAVFPNSSYIDTQKHVTKQLNKKLKAYCNKYGILYLNVNSQYEDENGILNPQLSENGGHHIHPQHNQPVKDALFKLLLDAASN